jgi:adenosylmethionine-8-amino-7-oxononanoate aminotransferase
LQRDPAALGRLTMGAREAGVLLRQLARGIAVSPPLTAGPEHFELIAQGIAAGLDAAAGR